jgi:hypothetical protein
VQAAGDEADEDPRLKQLTVWFFVRFLAGRKREVEMMNSILQVCRLKNCINCLMFLFLGEISANICAERSDICY